MPIKVTCSACGRSGRVPDHAIGRNVQCPGCGVRRRLSATDVVPEGPAGLDGLELLDDEPAPPVVGERNSQVRPDRSAPTAKSRRSDSQSSQRDASPGSDRSPALNPIVIGLGAGVVILSLSLGFVLISNRVSKPQPEKQATDQTVAQATPARPIPPLEPPPTSSPPPNLKPSSPALPAKTPNSGESVASDKANPTASDSEPRSDEPDFAKEARNALASSTPLPDTSKAKDSRTETPSGVVLSTADIVARCEPSVALIKGKAGSGTGFLVAPGILATNAHVIDSEFIGNLEIRFPSAEEARKGPVQAELLYEDAKRDLAFLAVKTDLPTLQVAQSYQYRKGEDVTVIGNPGVDGETVLENAISRGVMSSKAQINGQSFYQLGIAVNPGNSGGPVFDSTGQVIGVVTLRIPGKEELSFCIPVEELQAGMTRLKEQAPDLANKVRSQHRMVTAFKGLGSGGAIFGIALELRVASRSNPGNQDLGEKIGQLDKALAEMDQSILFKLNEEARVARNDLLITRAARTKVGELADNYKKLKETYNQNQGSAPINTIRSLKAKHRQLVVQIGADLKEEVPKGILEALDDHLVTGPAAPFPSSESLHSYVWERYGLTPPSSRLRPPGFGPGPGSRLPSRLSPRSRFGR